VTSSTLPAPASALDVIYRRRAIRAYTSDPLDEKTIRALLDAAVQAPTAMHEEPWVFVVVQDRTVLTRLSDRAKAGIAAEPAFRHLHDADGKAHSGDGFKRLVADPGFNIFYDAGTLIVIGTRPVSPFAAADCWLAAENLMLAACAMGLGTCCIGFAVAVLNTPEAKRELGIPADVTVVAPIIVGVPRGTPAPVGRKPPEIARWVR
jgi:nitroreductase